MEEKAVSVSIDQLTLEVKFYLNQTAQNIIEVGKRLTQAKEMLPHGEFGKWLDSNFGLSQSSANKFMAVSERFGNSELITNLKPTQLITMLALPSEETEKFIDEKAAEGKPVEDMTIKTLREEVAKYKAEKQKIEKQIKCKMAENLMGNILLEGMDCDKHFTRIESEVILKVNDLSKYFTPTLPVLA